MEYNATARVGRRHANDRYIFNILVYLKQQAICIYLNMRGK